MVDHLKTMQVVGFKNSGKTTLIEKIAAACRKADQRVGVAKHHGHGKLDKHDLSKDTGRFRESGAEVTAIAAGGGLEMIWERGKERWELGDILSFYQFLKMDIVLVEGFKQADLEKIVVVRNVEDFNDLRSLSNIAAVISWEDSQFEPIEGIERFHISEEERYLRWVLTRLGVESDER
ncbi:MAG TPA: molybdopterin-guanine dinucleotide biosynthesis protein B [Bacillales bacterium]|nr:molybdopterin-guanine dinucleotide biosynthesis protein B [Bacillales bacterium]